ncbi:MAG: family 10 glycosylhydrolase, partial [Clostridia bacterium]|nr:family 10 glycosylhydrolase [Clostridia bacterium]
MKRITAFLLCFMLCLSIIPGDLFAVTASDEEPGDSSGLYTPVNYENMKGIWLYQYTAYTSLFKDGTSQRSESSYRELVEQMINGLSRDGFNTVMLQMRPYGDSLYPSQYYSPSPYVISGTAYDGTNSAFAYDPLEVFLEIAHEKDISVHAWLNPMRLLTTSQLSAVNSQYVLKQWYNDSSKNGTYIVNVDGRYYLNPAYDETRQLVIDGVMEICEGYNIDGIHFDDYFYVSIDSESTDLAFDQAAFNLYGSSYGSASSLSVRKEFRRQQVNTLVRDIYSAMHEYNDDLVFGISPAGNIDNNQTGYLCADVKTWCSTPGYVDYICPQVYWSFDYSWDPAKFDICTDNWAAMCTTDAVDLVIGIATYRAENNATYSSTDPGWYNYKDNIARMIKYVDAHAKAKGYVFFKYESTYDIYTGEYNTAFSQEINNYIGLVAGTESDDTSTTPSDSETESDSTSSEVSSPIQPASDENVLRGKSYSTVYNSYNSSLKDSGSQLTDGSYRGDGIVEWNGDKGISGVTVEFTGTGYQNVITFNLDNPTDICKVVIKRLRSSNSRGYSLEKIEYSTDGTNYKEVTFTATSTAVDGSPTYSQTQGFQYYDLTADVSIKDAVNLRLTITPGSKYTLHLDE